MLYILCIDIHIYIYISCVLGAVYMKGSFQTEAKSQAEVIASVYSLH